MRLLYLLFLPAAAYQLLSIVAILRFAFQRAPGTNFLPAVSVLKPVLGLDPNTREAFRSQANQDYPEFEILFGVRDPGDPVVAAIEELQFEFPAVPIRVIQVTTEAPNGKVASLMDLSREARYPVWVVNDGDIAVTPSYLREVVAGLADGKTGVVTCAYRARAHSAATHWEALGITTDFMPSAMVAQLIGVRDFGFGSTLAFHAHDLKAAGGFEALAGYLADDYQLANRISRMGKQALLSHYVVETSLGEATWKGVWWHQVRWARTIRRSTRSGYAGLPITFAGVWALLAAGCGIWPVCWALLALRLVTASLSTGALRSRQSVYIAWLAPVWDLFAFAIWIAAWTGSTVRWRKRELRIGHDGRIAS